MSQRVVIIDNYDSFTHNLSQGFATLGARVSVVRNDAIEPSAIAERLYVLEKSATLLPEGPGRDDAAQAALVLDQEPKEV